MSGLPSSLMNLLVHRPTVQPPEHDVRPSYDSLKSSISSGFTDMSSQGLETQHTPHQHAQATITPTQTMATEIDTPAPSRPPLSHQTSSVRELPSSSSRAMTGNAYLARRSSPIPIKQGTAPVAYSPGRYNFGQSSFARGLPSTPSPPLRDIPHYYHRPSYPIHASSYPPVDLPRSSYRAPDQYPRSQTPTRPRVAEPVSPKNMSRDIHSADSGTSSQSFHPSPYVSNRALAAESFIPTRPNPSQSRPDSHRRASAQSHPYERPLSIVEDHASWHSSYPGRRPGDGTSLGSRAPISRATKACNACRLRKVRCDVGGSPGPEGQLMPCSRCKNADIDCVYVTGQRKRGPLAGTTRSAIPPSVGSLADHMSAASMAPKKQESYQRYYPDTREQGSDRDSSRSSFGSIETASLLTPNEMSRRDSYGFSPYGPDRGYQHQTYSAPPRFGSTLMPGPPPPLPPVPGSPTRQGRMDPRPLTSFKHGNFDGYPAAGSTDQVDRDQHIPRRGSPDGVGQRIKFPWTELSASYDGKQKGSGPGESPLFGSSGRELPALPGLVSKPPMAGRRESYRG